MKMSIKSSKHNFFFKHTDLSLETILRIFFESEPHDSYKNNSYRYLFLFCDISYRNAIAMR